MGSSAPTHVSSLSNSQQGIANLLGPMFANYLNQPNPQYNGQMVAGLDPGFAQSKSFATGFADLQSNALRRALSGKPSYDVSQAATNQYMRDTVLNPMLRTYDQQIAPRLKEAASAGGGLFSSRLLDAQQGSLDNIMSSYGAQAGQAVQQNQSLMAQLSDSAAGRQMQALTMPQQISGAMSSALQPFQQNKQQQLDAAFQSWQAQQPYANPYLSQAMSFMGQPQTVTYPRSNPVASGIGAGLGALQGLSLLGGSGGVAGGLSSIGSGIGAVGSGIGSALSGVGSGIGSLLSYLPLLFAA